MTRPAERVLTGPTARGVASATEKIAGEAMADIDAALPKALQGDREQLRLYVRAFNEMTRRVLDAVEKVQPKLTPPIAPWMRSALEGEAMRAPFSGWVGAMGPGRGSALTLVSTLRSTLPNGYPLPPPSRRPLPTWDLDDQDVVCFYRRVSELLEGAELPLARIRQALNLNRTELAALFGVTRQAVERWERDGIPAEREEKLATVGAIADLLEAQLKADRIGGVIRRAASAYGGRSALEAIAAGDEDLVLAELRDAFDWATTG